MATTLAKLKITAAVTLSAVLTCGVLTSAKQSPQGPNEDGTAPALTKITGEAMLESHAFGYLVQLSDDIGSRLTGSPEGQRGIDWAAAAMRGVGLENVHTEKILYLAWVDARRGASGTAHPHP